MPTFFDSSADAAEALEALRGLAHASRGFDEPAQMYGVIGELSAAMRSLRQVLDNWPMLMSVRPSVRLTMSGTTRRGAGRARCDGGTPPGGEPGRPGLRPARGGFRCGWPDRVARRSSGGGERVVAVDQRGVLPGR